MINTHLLELSQFRIYFILVPKVFDLLKFSTVPCLMINLNQFSVTNESVSESFSCPSGYYKCRESFCLERRFICDGEVQCAHKDDEQQCGKN